MVDLVSRAAGGRQVDRSTHKARSVDDRRLDNGAGGDLEATAFKMNVHRFQNRPAQVVDFLTMC